MPFIRAFQSQFFWNLAGARIRITKSRSQLSRDPTK